MRTSGLAIGVVVALISMGCGGDDDAKKGYGDPLASSQAGVQAKAAVEAAAGLQAIESQPASDAELTKVGGLFSAMSVMLSAKLAERPPAAKPDAEALVVPNALGAASQKPLAEGCFTVSAGKVTYDACDYGAGTIDGTITFGGGTFTVDLTVTYAQAETTFEVHETGAISVTSAAISGDLSIRATSTFGAATVNTDVSADFAVILVDGCATGGEMEVHGQWSVKSGQGNGDFDVWVKAEFGPACGSVTVY